MPSTRARGVPNARAGACARVGCPSPAITLQASAGSAALPNGATVVHTPGFVRLVGDDVVKVLGHHVVQAWIVAQYVDEFEIRRTGDAAVSAATSGPFATAQMLPFAAKRRWLEVQNKRALHGGPV